MGIVFGSCAKGYSPEAVLLLEATKAGDDVRATELLHRNPGLLTAKRGLSDDSTLLHAACKAGRLSFLMLLDEFARGPLSPFAELTEAQRQAKILALLNRTTAKGHTPLAIACKKGHAECVSFLAQQVRLQSCGHGQRL